MDMDNRDEDDNGTASEATVFWVLVVMISAFAMAGLLSPLVLRWLR